MWTLGGCLEKEGWWRPQTTLAWSDIVSLSTVNVGKGQWQWGDAQPWGPGLRASAAIRT